MHLSPTSKLGYLSFNRLYKIYSFYVLLGDVYDRLDYETHATDKTMCYL